MSYRTLEELEAAAAYLKSCKAAPIRYLTAAEILRSTTPWIPSPDQPAIIIDPDIVIPEIRDHRDSMDRDLYVDQIIGRLEDRNNMRVLDPENMELRQILYKLYRLWSRSP